MRRDGLGVQLTTKCEREETDQEAMTGVTLHSLKVMRMSAFGIGIHFIMPFPGPFLDIDKDVVPKQIDVP